MQELIPLLVWCSCPSHQRTWQYSLLWKTGNTNQIVSFVSFCDACLELHYYIIHKDEMGQRLLVVVNRVIVRYAYLQGMVVRCVIPVAIVAMSWFNDIPVLQICNARMTRPFFLYERGGTPTTLDLSNVAIWLLTTSWSVKSSWIIATGSFQIRLLSLAH